MVEIFRNAADRFFIMLLIAAGVSAAAMGKQPHMVIYLSDDHSQFDSSLYGAPDIPTPNFEKLASEGMQFSHAFVASPSCAPSRAAMLTGLMPARNGAEDNHSYPREDVPWLVGELQVLGYEVAAFGKVAHGKGASRVGFDVQVGASSYAAVRQSVEKFLTERTSDKPLCLFAGISNPHVPWPSESSFNPDEVVLPLDHLDTPSTREHRAAYYEEIKELDQLLGELCELTSVHLGEDHLFVHTSDHGSQWPFGKWNLYDYGIRVPFLVAWPSVVAPGSKSEAMIQWIDLMPTLIEIGGGEAPAGLDGRSILKVLQGKDTAHRNRIFTTHSGDRIMNIYPIRSVRTREWKLIRNLHPEFAFTNHSDLLRKQGAGAFWGEWVERSKSDARAKEIVDRYYKRPEWELYQVSEDKWEQRNLADDPKQTERLKTLQAELASWMKSQGDQESVFSEPRLISDLERWHPDHNKEAVSAE